MLVLVVAGYDDLIGRVELVGAFFLTLVLTRRLVVEFEVDVGVKVEVDVKGREVEIKADFVGFEIANEFVVGYGLDYANEYRTLPEIWTLQEAD